MIAAIAAVTALTFAQEVSTLSASNVTAWSARLYGAYGNLPTGSTYNVTFVYGPTDGGTNISGWASTSSGILVTPTALTTAAYNRTIIDLAASTTYYYRAVAFDDDLFGPTIWATQSLTFVTRGASPTSMPSVAYQSVVVDTNGVLHFPANFFEANGIQPTQAVDAIIARLDDLEATRATNGAWMGDLSAYPTNGAWIADVEQWSTYKGVSTLDLQANNLVALSNSPSLAPSGSFANLHFGYARQTNRVSFTHGTPGNVYGNAFWGAYIGNSGGSLTFSNSVGSSFNGSYEASGNSSLRGIGQMVRGRMSDPVNMGSAASGSAVFGRQYGGGLGGVTVDSPGSIVLIHSEVVGQSATIGENAGGSLVMGAATSTNKYAIVVGDGMTSRGEGSIVASGGFHGDAANVTNITLQGLRLLNTYTGGVMRLVTTDGVNFFLQ
jgi:hypothetical protein